MEEKLSKDSQPEVEAWPTDYEPPSLEELGSVWDETQGAVGTVSDGSLLMVGT